METNHSTLRLITLSSVACLLALGAGKAYAQDASALSVNAPISKVWIHSKTAISDNPSLIRQSDISLNVVRADEPLPDVIIPLNTSVSVTDAADINLDARSSYETNSRITDFDLVEDSPIFIGASSASEFDTMEATQTRGAYPEATFVEPLYTVAGAGVKTTF